MKKILAILFLVTSFVHAQYTIKGTMTPTIKSDWIILYKIEGARQQFLKNTTIKVDSISVDGKKTAIGNFEFTLPANAKPGSYRAMYRLENAGFVDFIFNKEDVSFTFNPSYPVHSLVFSSSKDNIFYKEYLDKIIVAQQNLDSLQVKVLQNPKLNLKRAYKKALKKVNSIQKKYLEASKGSYVNPLVKAVSRVNPPEILTTSQRYMSNLTSTFFNNIDFSNKTLLNSSFLIDKITEYVFYINYSDNKEAQQELYKNSVETVLSKISEAPFKKDVIEFLIAQFEGSRNIELIDFLFKNHYNKLPEGLQNKAFINEKKALFAAEVGRIAPDFSWQEDGKKIQLSKLDETENYVLVFWSTGCSHCLKEIPELHTFMKGNTQAKVIAFALEKDEYDWENYKSKLFGWHNVLGLKKWKNKTARTYNIYATPSYFILDANKKIIAKPKELKDLKQFFSKK